MRAIASVSAPVPPENPNTPLDSSVPTLWYQPRPRHGEPSMMVPQCACSSTCSRWFAPSAQIARGSLLKTPFCANNSTY